MKRAGTNPGPFQEDGGLVAVSLDFDAFFPSLDIEKSADIAKEAFENSNIDVKCDINELSLFIACGHSAKEIQSAGVTNVVHKRRFKNGTRPGMICPAITGGVKVRTEDQSWIGPSETPSPRQIMKLLGMMIY